jgi:hypothetical protein
MSSALKEDAEAMECFQRNISNKDGHPLKKKQGCQGAKSLTKGSAFDEIEKGHEVYWFKTKKSDGKIEYKYFTSCSNGVSTDALCRSHKDQQKQGKNPFMLMDEIRASDKHELLKLKGNEDFFKNQIEKKNRKNKKASNETSIEINLNDNPLYIVLQNFDKLPSSIKNNLLITCNQIIQENNLFETKTDKNVKELTLDNSTNKQLLQTIQQKQIEYDKCNKKEELFNLIHDDMEDEIIDTSHKDNISIASEHIEEDDLLDSDEDEPNSNTHQKSSDILSDSDNNEEHQEDENEIDAIEIKTKKGKLLYLNSEDYVVYEPEDGEFSELGKLEVVDASYATIDYMLQNWTILRKIDNPIESDEKNKEIYLCSLTNNVFNLQKKYLGVLTQKKNNMYVIKKNKTSK